MAFDSPDNVAPRRRVLWLSTVAFTLLFAVWLMFGVLGVPIRQELSLTDEQLAWLGAAAILAGSLPRLNFGLWADRFGGRAIFIATLFLVAGPTFWVSRANSFSELLVCALLFGLAGNSFSAGIAWNAAWFPPQSQGTALGIFGAGNVGASLTKFLGPLLLAFVPAGGLLGGWVPGGWRLVPVLYALLLVLMAAAVWRLAPQPDRAPGHGRPLREMLAPLRQLRVWQYSLDYVVVFGAYVALSLWLPVYYVDVYGLPLAGAALLTALFIFPASLLRPLGGWLSDRLGARRVLAATLAVIAAAALLLSVPSGRYVVSPPAGGQGAAYVIPYHLGVGSMTALVFVLGCGMGIGKAAVYKRIPEDFPQDVGAVGGLVGMLGALGGFVLPPAFVALRRWTELPQTAFAALFVLTAMSYGWLHCASLRSRVRTTEPAPAEVAPVTSPST